jgi:type I restriction enzyme S subunit
LGRGAVWHGEIEPCIHQNHIFAVRFDQRLVRPEFAEYEMLSWHAKSYFLGVAKKTTNLATINSTQLAAFPIKFPVLQEQRRIITHLDLVKQQSTELHAIEKQNGTLLAEMEQAILAQAFRGEL